MIIPWDKVIEVSLLLGQGLAVYLIRRNKVATASNRKVIQSVEEEVCRLNQTINNTTNCNFKCPMEILPNETPKKTGSQIRNDIERDNPNWPYPPI